MQKIILTSLLLSFLLNNYAQIQVSSNHLFLQDKNGKPFFWLGDTDWELFHRLTREEAAQFLEVRKQQGFNVIQAVALAEFNGLHQPNRYGDIPLINDDPAQLAITPGNDPNDSTQYDYWDNVDYVIKTAATKNMYIGLLPTWGDKVAHLWGDGPIIFNEKNAEIYARTLAERYKNEWNIIWILGGDRPVSYKTNDGSQYDDSKIWNAFAKGIKAVMGNDVFITYHIAGGPNSTSQFLQQSGWLSMNSFQSSHGAREVDSWNWVRRDLSYQPQKPTLDMEPCYEDHPVNPWDGKWTRQRGYFTAYDVRARIYRDVFAGACGTTYGHHAVWQFLNTSLNPTVNVGDTIIPWQKAIYSEAATEMQWLKNLMLSRPYFSRVNKQDIVVSDTGSTYINRIEACGNDDGSYAMIYLPQNAPVTIDMSKISGNKKNAWWYNVKNGKASKADIKNHASAETFTPPAENKDWVLVIDDGAKKYKAPGVFR
ncbi:MAG TPA: glycoside hydrolase family 140 protein [Parafilimonas sp.]|nr:glycoside hydrolase family 140 protein [Parafilimonas sp.]